MNFDPLRHTVEDACLALLNRVERDPFSPLAGCCDRRHWAWKLVDFPDATRQRAVQPLAWLLQRKSNGDVASEQVLAEAIVRALAFTARIQHADGSFDQAFPHEHSFGATAFVLDSCAAAFTAVEDRCDRETRDGIAAMLGRAATFLCRHREQHALIANHLAGAALGLHRAAVLLNESTFGDRAASLVQQILASQSGEGWFPEYGGADPGYQTLCIYYLAQVRQITGSGSLDAALERALHFLSYWVQPDGTFGGVYGSRRTTVYYPGGIALLSSKSPLAGRITTTMLSSALLRRVIGPQHIDDGNLVPLLANYQLALDSVQVAQRNLELPYERGLPIDFREAGLYVRASDRLWVIVGASNGGTVTVFDRQTGKRLRDDGGWVGADVRGLITSQVRTPAADVKADGDRILVSTDLKRMNRPVPTVGRFLLLRIAALTVFRFEMIREAVKAALVRLLIADHRPCGVRLERSVRVRDSRVIVQDVITGRTARLRWLRCGAAFVAGHMASAGYVVPGAPVPAPFSADVHRLAESGSCQAEYTVEAEETLDVSR